MLSYDDALNLNYYKKTSYTGWMKPIRFLIRMEKTEEADLFHAWVWPEPYTFDNTADEAKEEHTAPFSEEGKHEIVDWVNERQEFYAKNKKSLDASRKII